MAGGMKMYGKHRFPGRLFIVEGIDGSGKSTQLMLLQKWLESEGYVVYFSEWNSSPLVHEVTKRGKKKKMLTGMTFSLIHATDFADRTEHHIIPPLKAGSVHLHGVRARRRARCEPQVGTRSIRLCGKTDRSLLLSHALGCGNEAHPWRPRRA